MGVQVDRPGPLARTKLIGVGESILEHLHHRHYAGRLIFNALNRGAGFTQI